MAPRGGASSSRVSISSITADITQNSSKAIPLAKKRLAHLRSLPPRSCKRFVGRGSFPVKTQSSKLSFSPGCNCTLTTGARPNRKDSRSSNLKTDSSEGSPVIRRPQLALKARRNRRMSHFRPFSVFSRRARQE